MNFFSTTKAPRIPSPGTPGEGQGGGPFGRTARVSRLFSLSRYSGGGLGRGSSQTMPVLLWTIALCALLLLVGPGCQTSKPARAHPANTDFSGDFATNSFEDACATRLVDIEGALLEYYVTMHHWPASLDELKPLSSTPLELTCPVSKQRYIYNPLGLEGSADPRKLIVYDALPSHNNSRWGIVLGHDVNSPTPALDVKLIPEAAFRQYHQSAPKPPPTFEHGPRQPNGKPIEVIPPQPPPQQ